MKRIAFCFALFLFVAFSPAVGAWPAVQVSGTDSIWHTGSRTTFVCHVGLWIIPATDLGPLGCQQVRDAAAKAKHDAATHPDKAKSSPVW